MAPRRRSILTVQTFRSALLAVVFAGLVLVPLANYVEAAGASRGALPVDSGLFRALSWLSSSSLYGSVWSLNIAGFEWVDALAVVSLLVLGGFSGSVSTTVLVGFVPALLLTALLGRFFCGWICPMRFLVDLLQPVKRRVRRRFKGLQVPAAWAKVRYVLLVVFVVLVVLTQSHVLSLIYPPAITVRAGYELVFFGSLNVLLVLVALYLVVDLVLITGFWCRYLCPGGVLYSLFGSFRILRIRTDLTVCKDCQACRRACPMGLDPVADSTGLECDNCGKCVASCANGAIKYRWGYGKGQ